MDAKFAEQTIYNLLTQQEGLRGLEQALGEAYEQSGGDPIDAPAPEYVGKFARLSGQPGLIIRVNTENGPQDILLSVAVAGVR